MQKNRLPSLQVKGGRPSEQARLLHEILILEKCRSSHVVQFLGYAISDDGLLLCMEFLSGGTLYESLKREATYQWYNRWAVVEHRNAFLDMYHTCKLPVPHRIEFKV